MCAVDNGVACRQVQCAGGVERSHKWLHSSWPDAPSCLRPARHLLESVHAGNEQHALYRTAQFTTHPSRCPVRTALLVIVGQRAQLVAVVLQAVCIAQGGMLH